MLTSPAPPHPAPPRRIPTRLLPRPDPTRLLPHPDPTRPPHAPKAIDALLAQCPTQPSKFNEFKHIMHQCPMYFNESGIFLGDVGGSEHGCSKLIDKVVRLLGARGNRPTAHPNRPCA